MDSYRIRDGYDFEELEFGLPRDVQYEVVFMPTNNDVKYVNVLTINVKCVHYYDELKLFPPDKHSHEPK
jgi:hypothetical protein